MNGDETLFTGGPYASPDERFETGNLSGRGDPPQQNVEHMTAQFAPRCKWDYDLRLGHFRLDQSFAKQMGVGAVHSASGLQVCEKDLLMLR